MEAKMDKKLDLKDIVLIGRTFDEYYKMFDLRSIDKKEKILDVASGVSSFCAEATVMGYQVTASDRIYCLSAQDIEKKCAEDLEDVLGKLPEIKDLYKWEFFRDIEGLRKQRRRAYKSFVEDYKQNSNGVYVNTQYPKNDFKYKQFNIALISHFLFMYDEHLNYEFHKETIKEIMKITSKEIRIFPLVNLKGKKSQFVEELIKDEEFYNNKIKVVKVDYEFVKGGNEMLVIKVQ
jgi:hypothetical protein